MEKIFNIVINLLGSLVQIICYPLNAMIVKLMPDLSLKIVEINNNVSTLFDSLIWGLGLIPGILKTTLILIVSMEIVRFNIYLSTRSVLAVVHIIKKLKFW